MGQLTDTLRATLRDLAQSDARLYRGLQQELVDGRPSDTSSSGVLAGDVPASRDELSAQSKTLLLGLCKQRAIPRLSGRTKDQLIDLLLSHAEAPPFRSDLPVKSAKASKGAAATDKIAAKSGAVELQALEHRLERLEQLLLLIAQQVGVPPEATRPLSEDPGSRSTSR